MLIISKDFSRIYHLETKSKQVNKNVHLFFFHKIHVFCEEAVPGSVRHVLCHLIKLLYVCARLVASRKVAELHSQGQREEIPFFKKKNSAFTKLYAKKFLLTLLSRLSVRGEVLSLGLRSAELVRVSG